MDKQTATQLIDFIQRFENEKPLYELQTKPLTMMPYRYNTAIKEFVQFCYDNDFMKSDFYNIMDDLKKNYEKNNEWFNSLSEEQVIQSLAVIIRQERFSDGLIKKMIENETILKLLNRIKVLHNL